MLPKRLYSSLPNLAASRTVAVIDTEALVNNYKLLCSRTPGVKHICTVKADAYGHTVDICVRTLLAEGCSFFAVSCIEEAISVRRVCLDEGRRADILILGYTDPSLAPLLAEHDLIQTVLSLDFAYSLAVYARAAGVAVRTHVALDTGMNRIGLCVFNDEECARAAADIVEIRELDGISVEGLFTHFAKADEGGDEPLADSTVKLQSDRFISVKKILERSGVRLFCHVCNSAAAYRFPELGFDGVRLGIMLYGVRSGEFFDERLKPVMELCSVVSHVHTLPIGESVSYGGTFSSDTERTIATLPFGYADGFSRAYSGCRVTVHTSEGDFKAEVVGRVCMDQCMIDVTDMPVRVGDGVTVFGGDGEALEELAAASDTIEYECLCRISARVPRVIKDNVKNKLD